MCRLRRLQKLNGQNTYAHALPIGVIHEATAHALLF